MSNMVFNEGVKVYQPGDDFSPKKPKIGTQGEIEFIVRDKNGTVLNRWFEQNIVKIFAKEMLSHRLPSTEVWDPDANAWVNDARDADEEFAARYILFGASFDDNGLPLDTDDTRYYNTDPVTGSPVPVRLGPGADYEGGLINAIPLAEPMRPLKRVEDVSFQATYQPAGSPLVQDDVRALNNVVRMQTTLQLDEYNGIGMTDSDFFTITEVALAGGRKIDSIGSCELTPRELFLEGASDGTALNCVAAGTDVISIAGSESEVDLVKEGDQIKIVSADATVGGDGVVQTNPYYMVLSKAVGGRDIQLDRTPVNTSNTPLTGSIGIFRDTLRVFSHRVLSAPVKKSSDFEIEVIWSIIFN
jgi:hypothetical protein